MRCKAKGMGGRVTEAGDVVSVWIQESPKVLKNLTVLFAYVLTQMPDKEGEKMCYKWRPRKAAPVKR